MRELQPELKKSRIHAMHFQAAGERANAQHLQHCDQTALCGKATNETCEDSVNNDQNRSGLD